MSEKSVPLTEQLRRAIAESGLSRYRIAKETGISESTLSQFHRGHRGLSMHAIDAIGALLDLRITTGRRSKTEA